LLHRVPDAWGRCSISDLGGGPRTAMLCSGMPALPDDALRGRRRGTGACASSHRGRRARVILISLRLLPPAYFPKAGAVPLPGRTGPPLKRAFSVGGSADHSICRLTSSSPEGSGLCGHDNRAFSQRPLRWPALGTIRSGPDCIGEACTPDRLQATEDAGSMICGVRRSRLTSVVGRKGLVRKATSSGRWSSGPGFERPELRTIRTPGHRSRTTLANAMPSAKPALSPSTLVSLESSFGYAN
jgi:hypothetical protein